jgi:DNA-binding NtrC family response regulator
MIIDDDINIRTALSRELRFHHYNIIPAETGLMALNKLKNQYVDTVIVDIRMPVMNGLEFISKVVQDYPHIKIIILSGTVTKEVLTYIQRFKKNIIDVMAKPWDSDKLIDILEASEELNL